MNNCTVFGYLGQDPEFSKTQNDVSILKFSLGNTTGFGERKQTNWFSCVAFGERWERVAEYLKKGSPVVVSGEVTLNTWTNKDGQEKSRLQLMVQNISLAGGDKEKSAPPPKEKVKLNNDGMPNW